MKKVYSFVVYVLSVNLLMHASLCAEDVEEGRIPSQLNGLSTLTEPKIVERLINHGHSVYEKEWISKSLNGKKLGYLRVLEYTLSRLTQNVPQKVKVLASLVGLSEEQLYQLPERITVQNLAEAESIPDYSRGNFVVKLIKQVKIMQEMQARLKVAGVEILDYKSAKKFFNSWIREKYKEDQREEVKAIAFPNSQSDSNYRNDMAIAITFLKKFHPSKDERNRWLDKFIEEPTADYKKRIVDGMYEVDATF